MMKDENMARNIQIGTTDQTETEINTFTSWTSTNRLCLGKNSVIFKKFLGHCWRRKWMRTPGVELRHRL
ncbi:unnamed protein product [Cylicocyclus nassatus]|uniref:Uncharacterized protein n=1 Tax=Cylicocyclus nassatus TaxID=53992 RepID=A0AA36HG17_CYLNA|nr:unnamed protein product [Cylicocyclus nassatus]